MSHPDEPSASDDAIDRQLIARCGGGDQLALRALLERFQPRLWGYLWHLLGGDRESVEDVIQEVMLAVWQHARDFRGEARVATWIFRLAHHRAANVRRTTAWQASGNAITLDEAVVWSTALPSPETAIAQRVDLAAAIAALPPKQREVLALLFVQGFTQAEAAEILRVPLGTIKSRLAQAREQIKDHLCTSQLAPEEAEHA